MYATGGLAQSWK
jgi:hypothetical protein